MLLHVVQRDRFAAAIREIKICLDTIDTSCHQSSLASDHPESADRSSRQRYLNWCRLVASQKRLKDKGIDVVILVSILQRLQSAGNVNANIWFGHTRGRGPARGSWERVQSSCGALPRHDSDGQRIVPRLFTAAFQTGWTPKRLTILHREWLSLLIQPLQEQSIAHSVLHMLKDLTHLEMLWHWGDDETKIFKGDSTVSAISSTFLDLPHIESLIIRTGARPGQQPNLMVQNKALGVVLREAAMPILQHLQLHGFVVDADEALPSFLERHSKSLRDVEFKESYIATARIPQKSREAFFGRAGSTYRPELGVEQYLRDLLDFPGIKGENCKIRAGRICP